MSSGNTSNLVKIVGYAQAVQYGNGIEYTNFDPDLVGFQLAAKGGTPLMTLGNFYITTNVEPQASKIFIKNKFSGFFDLEDLNLTLPQAQTLLTNNASVLLNLDPTNINNYALFGSLSEFIRVSLEDIITNWPASLYLYQYGTSTAGEPINGYTYQNYTYDPISQTSSFVVNNNFIINEYEINYLQNGNVLNTFNETNSLRNLSVSYASYAILYNGVEYPVLGFTGSTYQSNDYLYFLVQGNVFSGLPSNYTVSYHIKPNKLQEEQFFNALPPFEAYLLNRKIYPIYTSTFKYPVKSDNGVIVYVTNQLTWPVSDGYNIDFNTTAYATYAGNLYDIATDNDSISSDLVNRFLVSESISGFDTLPVVLSTQDQDNTGQKVTKTLRIYGAEFDEINNFITGLAYANVVTYDKQDNTPDVYLKQLAQVLGWGLITPTIENDLLAHFVTTNSSTYSGQSVGLTSAEADIELWRRIILNTPWIWKSKGTRKDIEFLLKFIGTPKGLIQFNEYIYRAKAPIDLNIFVEALQQNGLSTDLTLYPIDENGYPSPLANTSKLYYQNNGLWYRETGGSGSTIDITSGNNPHLGPYDGGYTYINQFRELIPNFSAVTISSQTITQNTENLFVNYNLGTVNEYSGSTYVTATNVCGNTLSNCVVVQSEIIPSPYPVQIINECGCTPPSQDDSLSICVSLNENIANTTPPCSSNLSGPPVDNQNTGLYVFSYYQYNQDGSLYSIGGNPILNNSIYTNQSCCTMYGGLPTLYTTYTNGVATNSGYICCDGTGKCGCQIACSWMVNQSPLTIPVVVSVYPFKTTSVSYLTFNAPDGSNKMVTPDGCNCISQYTTAVPNVTDIFTGQVGYACQLTALGTTDLAKGNSSIIYNTYLNRSNGKSGCFSVYNPNPIVIGTSSGSLPVSIN